MANDNLTFTREFWYAQTKNLSRKRRWWQRKSSFDKFMDMLEAYPHTYDTICYAVTAAGLAAMRNMNRSEHGGITGFQASAVLWEFIGQWLHLKDVPLRLVQYDDMLYPSQESKFKTITPSCWKWLQERALVMSREPNVPEQNLAHLHTILQGKVPFGFTVEEK